MHASSLPLFHSTTTGLVSPQFHVIFDDRFSTVKCLLTYQIPTNWSGLFNTSSIFYVDEAFTKTIFFINLFSMTFFFQLWFNLYRFSGRFHLLLLFMHPLLQPQIFHCLQLFL
jgi:hypothetical protein